LRRERFEYETRAAFAQPTFADGMMGRGKRKPPPPRLEDVFARLGPQADVRAEMRERDVQVLRGPFADQTRRRQDDQDEIERNMQARRAAHEQRARLRPGRR
jgi:hypothetical protein